MWHFVFRPELQAKIASGAYEVVRSKITGEPLGLVRDKVTGQFVKNGLAIGQKLASPQFCWDNFNLSPTSWLIQPILSGAQMWQTHRGFQHTYGMLNTLQSSVGVLQATTAAIGVGTVTGAVLSGVNLWQTFKLRQDIKQLRLEVQNGFIDLKKALRDQGAEIIDRINLVSEDVEFRHHRTILTQAYGVFSQALDRLNIALKIQNIDRRNTEIDAARGMLFQALADYSNPGLFQHNSAAGYLRRVECSWAIEQAIITTYQLQEELNAASDRLESLQQKIRQNSLEAIELCHSQDELDFLFPEIAHLHFHDVAVLKTWKTHIDWIQELSPEEKQQLAEIESDEREHSASENAIDEVTQPIEVEMYRDWKQKSHYSALCDQLRFIVQPELRQPHEAYICDRAQEFDRPALAPSNWQEVPDFTVANLYHYFKTREGTQMQLAST